MYKHIINRSQLFAFFFLILIHTKGQTNYTYQTFDDTRIINGHSVETNTEGVLTFIIAHRFGPSSNDPNYLWGIDNAQMRMGLQYGVKNNLMLGVGRNSIDKTLDGFIKYKILHQSSGDKNMPITLSALGYVAFQPQLVKTPLEYSFQQKLAFSTQVMIARKFSDRFSIQLTPTYLHRNLVADEEYNDVLSMGTALQWQVLKNWSLIGEYYYTPSNSLPDENSTIQYVPSLSLGFQIDTKGHIFQFNIGNSNGMTERIFIAESTGSWKDRSLYFGFNITRDFKVKGRRER